MTVVTEYGTNYIDHWWVGRAKSDLIVQVERIKSIGKDYKTSDQVRAFMAGFMAQQVFQIDQQLARYGIVIMAK